MTKPFDTAARAEWRANWPVVAGAAIGLGTGIALYALLSSLFVTSFNAEFGWSRGDMSLAGAAAFIAGALSYSVIGRALDRVGFRTVLLVCVPVVALVYLGLTLMTGSFALYVALLIVAGLFGTGTSAMVYTRPVVGVFDRQRGLALAVAASGTSLAAIVVAPLVAHVIEVHGWRTGAYGLLVVTLFVGLPLALALIGGAREQRVTDEAELQSQAAALAKVPDVPLRVALRGLPFWLLAFALVAVNIPGSGVVSQLAPIVTDKGLSETAAGIALSIYAAGILVGRLATGFALDYVPAPWVAAVMTGVPALGTLLLLVPEPSFVIAAVAVALIGLQQGSEVDLLAFFVSRTFGIKNYGTIFGAIATAGALATATGLVLFGQVHDFTKSYNIALIVGTISFAVGAACFYAMHHAPRPAPVAPG
jgi:sugar phosphate permease